MTGLLILAGCCLAFMLAVLIVSIAESGAWEDWV